MVDNRYLDIGIIGAGIAGLAACAALRKEGHNVELFEKSQFKTETGAAMTITPNGNRVLDALGFDFEKAGSTDRISNRRVDSATMENLAYEEFPDTRELYGHRFCAFHRVDIHNELRALAESGAYRGAVSFRLGSEVLELDCEAGIMTLKDGTKIKKDLIVVADGIKSRFVEAINGVEVPRTFTGMSIHRTLIDIDTLMSDSRTRSMYEGYASGFLNTMNKKTGIFFVTYPCRNDKVMNTAIIHRSKPGEQGGDDWNAQADIDDVLDLLKDGFHESWSTLVKSVEPKEWKCFPVSTREPIDHLCRGNAVIIGDAAHACLPTHAQGGAMGLEDAGALGVLFKDFKSGDSVKDRLKIYHQLRQPRSATTQLLSNAQMYHRDGDEVVAVIRRYYPGDVPIGIEAWSAPICRFFYNYDVLSEAGKALQYVDLPDGIPDGGVKYFGDMNTVAVH